MKKKASKIYSAEEAYAASRSYFQGDELAARVWADKYALKDSAGNLFEQNPADMHHRLAGEFARIEARYPNPLTEAEIFHLLDHFRLVVPQGGPMTGIGNNLQVASLSNCFVIGPEDSGDSYGAIMKMDEEQVQLMKRRGGVGQDLSHLRPRGAAVQNSALTSTGLVPFMERYSNSTREVAQGGRRGALMLSLSVQHPDAEDFINAKADGTRITGANVSVKVDDAFMEAVEKDSAYKQQFPVGSAQPKVTREIRALDLWNKIVHNAWKSAEPGLLFWDTVIRESLPDCYADLGFRTVSTNPCGEIPLCPYDSCRLLAVNLLGFVEKPFTAAARFNFELFASVVGKAQRLADDQVDLELEKITAIQNKIDADPESEDTKAVERRLWEKIREKCINGRRTGTGVTALGDTLAALGLRYGSRESLDFIEELFRHFALAAYRSSVEMAEERGGFPIYSAQREKDNPFLARLRAEDPELHKRMKKHGRRNIALLTIAPTGTTSLLTQTTSGIEPVFTVAYRRRRKVNPGEKNVRVDHVDEHGDSWEEFTVVHKGFERWMEAVGLDPQKLQGMPQKELDELVARSPYFKATAQDVDWVSKVELQGRVQKWIDHSISVTVNLPSDVEESLIHTLYFNAWKSGCKGITVYRDGSRGGVLLTSESGKKAVAIAHGTPPERPERLEARLMRFNNASEKWLAVVGLLNGQPYEIFTGRAEDAFSLPAYVQEGFVIKSRDEQTGRGRYDFQYTDKSGFHVTIEGLSRSFDPEYWNYAKLISGVLRHGMPLQDVVDLVQHLNLVDTSLNTWKNGVVRSLKQFIPNGVAVADKTCPQCGESALKYVEGCITCSNCGHSECS